MNEELSFPHTLTLAGEGTERIAKRNNALLKLLFPHSIPILLTLNIHFLLLDILTLVLLIELFQLAEHEIIVIPHL